MDYIEEVAPLLAEMEDQLESRGRLVENDNTDGFTLELLHPIDIGATPITAVPLARPTLRNLSAPGSRSKGDVRRNVQIIRNLSGLTTKIVHSLSMADYLTLVEQFRIWRDSS